jgi:hypothetical protein
MGLRSPTNDCLLKVPGLYFCIIGNQQFYQNTGFAFSNRMSKRECQRRVNHNLF